MKTIFLLTFLYFLQVDSKKEQIAIIHIKNSEYIKEKLKENITNINNIRLSVFEERSYIDAQFFLEDIMAIKLGRKGLGFYSKDSAIYNNELNYIFKENKSFHEYLQKKSNAHEKKVIKDFDLFLEFYHYNDSLLIASITPRGQILGYGVNLMFHFSNSNKIKNVYKSYWQN